MISNDIIALPSWRAWNDKNNDLNITGETWLEFYYTTNEGNKRIKIEQDYRFDKVSW